MKTIPWIPAIFAICIFSGALLSSASTPAAASRGTSPLRSGTVTYKVISNGHEAPEEGKTVVRCFPPAARIAIEEPGLPLPGAARETKYVDYAAAKTYAVADVPGRGRCSQVTELSTLPKLEWTQDRAVILGYPCRRAKTVIRSNQIEVWSTEKAGLQGTPALNLVVPGGLVLRVVRNGNYEIVAEKIDFDRKQPAEALLPPDWGEIVDQAAYRARVTESFVTACEIFHREQICFHSDSLPGKDSLESGGPDGPAGKIGAGAGPGAGSRLFRFAGGTLLLRRVRLPRAGADANLFAELVERSRGDAYDRTGSIFLIPTDRAGSLLDGLRRGVKAMPGWTGRDGRTYRGIAASDSFLPPLELMRFITPFGIGFFNSQVTVSGVSWEDSVVYRQDLTDLLPVLQGDVWIGAFIGNYDSGGHEVSLRLRYHPGSRRLAAEPDSAAGSEGKAWFLPLFNTVNVMEMAGQEYGRIFARDSLRVEFEIPPGLKTCSLRYQTTGHGGWENGDEFNPRTNQILLDGRPLAAITPWRTDCATYRRFNPASGNFWNGISSSDLSRSGWCPGALVDPYLVPLPGIAPGRHVLTVAIPMGEPEGGSFSAWNVSGLLVGKY